MVQAHVLRSAPSLGSTLRVSPCVGFRVRCQWIYLGNTKSSPFIFPQQLQRAFGWVKIVFGYALDHVLG